MLTMLVIQLVLFFAFNVRTASLFVINFKARNVNLFVVNFKVRAADLFVLDVRVLTSVRRDLALLPSSLIRQMRPISDELVVFIGGY